MRRFLAIWLLLSGWFLACGRPPDPGTVATYSGGGVTIAEVEGIILSLPAEQRLAREVQIVDTYREIAQQLALQRILFPDFSSAEEGYEARSEEFPGLFRWLVGQLYIQEIGGLVQISVSEEEIESHYKRHSEDFHRDPSRLLSHIYRRHREPGGEQETRAFLQELRKRAAAGESFAALAREFSDSETRGLGGRLGWIGPGTLPRALEAAAFALQPGEVSQPIDVPGGAVLFYVEDAVEEKSFPLEDVRQTIALNLHRQKVEDFVESVVQEVELPENSIVLDQVEFQEVLRAGDEDAIVFQAGDWRVTLGQFLAAGARPSGVPATQPDVGLYARYRGVVQRHRLYLRAAESGFPDRADVQQQVAASLRQVALQQAVERRAMEAFQGEGYVSREELRQFYEENRERYLSPLRLRLELLRLEPVSSPERQFKELVELREELIGGGLSLDQAGVRIGAEIVDIGWRSSAELSEFDVKVSHYLLDLHSTGYTPVYRLGNSLQLMGVMERQEPQALPFEEVEDRVRADYHERHKQKLYASFTDRTLEQARFRFLEEHVRRALEPSPGG